MPRSKSEDPMVLPLFDGRHPDNVVEKFSGNVTLDPPVAQALHVDATVYFVVECTATNVGHRSTTKDGVLSRTHALKVVRCAPLDLQTGGDLIIDRHRELREAAGISELALVGDGHLGGDTPDGDA